MPSYTTARGLNYLVDTPLYGELLASFTATYDPADNVALGAEFQGIYRVDWDAITQTDQHQPWQPSTLQTVDQPAATLNVGELDSEAAVDYHWQVDGHITGFATEAYTLDYVDCAQAACTVTDGGRRINAEEIFTLPVEPGQAHVLITRLHPGTRGTFDVYADGEFIATRWIPDYPGRWLEVATYLPATTADTIDIRIAPQVEGGYYMPYYHWLYTADTPTNTDTEPLATFQDGAFALQAADLTQAGQTVTLDLNWQTNGVPVGDYKLFVHLYDDIHAQPVQQLDTYAGNDTLPVGNWPPGVFSDQIMVDLSAIAPGTYAVAIGFYDPNTFERLHPTSDGTEHRLRPAIYRRDYAA